MSADFNPTDRQDAREFLKRLVGGKREYHQPCLGDKIRFMARSGGYVMVRKPHCMPFVLSEKAWAKLPTWDEAAVLAAAKDILRAQLRASIEATAP